jgi:hypothetical protein
MKGDVHRERTLKPRGYYECCETPCNAANKMLPEPHRKHALHIAKHSINPDVGTSHPVEIAFVYANGLGGGGVNDVQSVSLVII